jgi:hypothetical protein
MVIMNCDLGGRCHDLSKNDIRAFAWRDRNMSKCFGQVSQSPIGGSIGRPPKYITGMKPERHNCEAHYNCHNKNLTLVESQHYDYTGQDSKEG